jgi:glucose/arabinose dehydrogenase
LYGAAAVAVVGIGLGAVWASSDAGRRQLILWASPDLASGAPPSTLAAVFDGPDEARRQVPIRLTEVIAGLTQPTDIQFAPGHPTTAIVLEKQGRAVRTDVATGEHSTWFSVDVESRSEMGLLGLAFAPDFARSGRFVVHLSPPGGRSGRVELWECQPDLGAPHKVSTVLEVEQPFPNHDGGQVAFGPDGHLYVGLGDGGSGNDPKGHGQNGRTLLGSILRISPRADGGYTVPADNPFVGNPAVDDAAFAIGLRNPWRFSFDGQGRLIVGDVGQNRYEEVSIVTAGANMGWAVREARHCMNGQPTCGAGMLEPIWEYGRDEGVSITGGVVYDGPIAALRGQWLFADFGSGRLWALGLPAVAGTPAEPPLALGRWPISPSTFGRDAAGKAYVADFVGGSIYRLDAP